MSKKIIFSASGFPNFSEDGEYSTDLDTNRIDRFYLEDGELKDKWPGKTDDEIAAINAADHKAMVAEQLLADEKAVADRLAKE